MEGSEAPLAEERCPLGLETPEREAEPVRGGERSARQTQTGLVDEAVLLARVTPAAGRHHVLPGVLAASRPRHDVIDVLRGRAAVLAPPVVPGEHGPARARGLGPAGASDEAP